MPRALATGRSLGTRTLRSAGFMSNDVRQSINIPSIGTGNAGSAVVTDGAAIQNIFSGNGGAVSFWVFPRGLGGGNSGNYINKSNGSGSGWIIRLAGSLVVRFVVGFSTTQGDFRVFNGGLKNNDWNFFFVWYNSSSDANLPVSYTGTKNSALAKPSVGSTTLPVGTYNSDAGLSMYFGNASSSTNRGADSIITDVKLWRGAEPTQGDVINLFTKHLSIPTMTLVETWNKGAGSTFASASGLFDATINAPTFLDTALPFTKRTLAV